MFSKILIANRGEIAVRIIRACKEMGVATVAVYSQADAQALHVALADERYCIGGPEPEKSYLDQQQLIRTALLAGAQAIHPGYGFLSENAGFARLCQQHGLVFIGPGADTMERLSDKAALKTLAAQAGLPVIPGTGPLDSPQAVEKAARDLGYPVMLKACAGGGGRGIRLLQSPEEVEEAYHQAVSEARRAFGDGRVYLEKYISPARHVELQMLADEHGNAVCLGDRDCSLQRRNQKLVEETPSPGVGPDQRAALLAQAVEAVKKLGYVGAGTLEFLLDAHGRFWFMEMNVRLQVEHGVTEILTGLDLVKWQLRIAAGVPLAFGQGDVDLTGAAMECRVNARGCGTVRGLHIPGGPGVRFDTALLEGTEVTPYYDPLLGKLIVFGQTREEALRKLRAALCELVIEGVPTDREDQLRTLAREEFTSGRYDLTLLGNGGTP